ncbi:MAG: bifunctional adenosylcobinamide kinase/adenosylcobinamide-phosphate guanylyltransferase [Limnochordia bacterium]
MSLILVLGGARSGKSSFAEGLMAKHSSPGNIHRDG